MRRAAALWLVLFAACAATVGLRAAPGVELSEPERRALAVAESIVRDGDLDVADELAAARLRPAGRPVEGRTLDPVGIGFPLLVAPAWALGGRVGVELFLAAIAALGFVLAAALARRLVPEPWATGAALAGGLTVPALLASTTIAADAVAGTALAGAALLALRVRERPGLPSSAACAALVAVLPWLGTRFFAPTAIVAFVLWRWQRRRRRGFAGLVALEIVLFSAVLYVTVNDRLYGGPAPEAIARPPGPTGADGVVDHLARAPRLLGLWIDRDVGVLRWAPVAALAGVALWLLARSHRERLGVALPRQVDVEVAALFLAALCGAAVLMAVFLAPTIEGPWPPARELACVMPAAAALGAWGLRRLPRTGRVLLALSVLASAWVLVGARIGDGAGVAPPRGPLPWGGVERVLPVLR